jgi:hypothetical protein
MQSNSIFSDFLRQFSLPDNLVQEEEITDISDHCAGLNESCLDDGPIRKSQLDVPASSMRARPTACTQCSLAKKKCLNTSGTPPCTTCVNRGLDCSGFAYKEQRNEHMEIVRRKGRRQNEPCPICKKIFSRPDSVLRHMRKFHLNYLLSANSPAISHGILSESASSLISIPSTDTIFCCNSGSDM